MSKELLLGIETAALEVAFQVRRGCGLEVTISDGVTTDISNVPILKTLLKTPRGAARATGLDRIVEVTFVTEYGEMVISVEHTERDSKLIATRALWIWMSQDPRYRKHGLWEAKPVRLRCSNCNCYPTTLRNFHNGTCSVCVGGQLVLV